MSLVGKYVRYMVRLLSIHSSCMQFSPHLLNGGTLALATYIKVFLVCPEHAEFLAWVRTRAVGIPGLWVC